MNDLADLGPVRAPGPARPLAGLTILLVEDSRLASEGMRLLCRHAGARLRRADTLLAAQRHLRIYRPGAVIVDLHLPDGSGLDLIADLARRRPRLDAILATSADPAGEGRARDAGADGFLPKPLGLSAFLSAATAVLPRVPRLRPDPGFEDGHPDALALREDLEHAESLLAAPATPLDYVLTFLRGVARTAGDDGLATALAGLPPGPHARPQLARVLRRRLEGLATI